MLPGSLGDASVRDDGGAGRARRGRAGLAVNQAEGRLALANRLIDAEPRPEEPTAGAIGRLERLCSALARALPASGVGICVRTDTADNGGTVAAWGPWSRELEDLQFVLGEGPCLDAYATRRPVLEPDLGQQGMRRWPGYASAAQGHGAKAVFAFPLQIGAARSGALDIYRDHPGSLTREAVAQASSFADVAMGLLLDAQADSGRTPTSSELDDALAHRLEVYQAQGMLKVDLGVGLDEALARLRAHAYATDRPVSDVARDIVAGILTLGGNQT